MDSDELYSSIKGILIDQFEVDESAISLDANLYDELEIDSIDAVDLLVQLKELTGKKISPDVFKDVRTIRDVLSALTSL
ncbi:MAG: acyl carrier protein [Gammaproteobacteria bacterium]|jgi:acyl carrier protein|nr:acyl carrier protein [Gammaproteobacteria bacterium]MDH3749064.1 acyl carrier protein [Gammaproteobacteria bacterium]MDH3805979.1 acyl carrier protein [Gammaproteobacteria bacterium]